MIKMKNLDYTASLFINFTWFKSNARMFENISASEVIPLHGALQRNIRNHEELVMLIVHST